jgi:YbbR domain-containing protein
MIIINSSILIILLIISLFLEITSKHSNKKQKYRKLKKTLETESVQNSYIDTTKNKKGIYIILFLSLNDTIDIFICFIYN